MKNNWLRLSTNELVALDQTRLPGRKVWLRIRTTDELVRAIKRLAIRGAPALGVAGAYGLLIASKRIRSKDFQVFTRHLVREAEVIASARPTAVNLAWGVERVLGRVLREALSVQEARSILKEEALRVHEEDGELCRRIAEAGVSLIRPGDGVLTHCNAGSLATGGMGTALAPLYLAKKRGVKFHVYADETRPLLQGARLTAWELAEARVPHTLICDNMAASLMRSGKVTKVIVGADRIAANGDTANKIGTYGVAVLARHHGIPFYVAAPGSTFDLACPSERAIPIEERASSEVLPPGLSPAKTGTWNPAFDVTPARLIAGFITDRGLIRPPFPRNIKKAFSR